jgi:hypothetical protein
MTAFSTFTYAKKYYVSNEMEFETGVDTEFGTTYNIPKDLINLLADNILVYDKVGIGTTETSGSLKVIGDVSISGISTLGTVKISSGIVTATSGIVTYYGSFVGNITGQTLQKTSTIDLGGQFPSSGTTFSNAIPSSANEITVLFSGVKLPDSGHLLILAQPTTGTSTYSSNSTIIQGNVSSNRLTSTSGLIFWIGGANTNNITGQVTLKKHITVSGNHRWIVNGTFIFENAPDFIGWCHGYLETTASAPVTRIFISNTTSVVFTAGEVSVVYQ